MKGNTIRTYLEELVEQTYHPAINTLSLQEIQQRGRWFLEHLTLSKAKARQEEPSQVLKEIYLDIKVRKLPLLSALGATSYRCVTLAQVLETGKISCVPFCNLVVASVEYLERVDIIENLWGISIIAKNEGAVGHIVLSYKQQLVLDNYKENGFHNSEQEFFSGYPHDIEDILRQPAREAIMLANGDDLGMQMYERGKYDEALAHFELVLRKNPSYEYSLLNKGATLTQLGRFSEALECCDQFLKLYPKHATAWNNKGEILYRMGNLELGLDCIEQALKFYPEHQLALRNKRKLLAKIQNRK